MPKYNIEIINIETSNPFINKQIKGLAKQTTQGKSEEDIFRMFEVRLCNWFNVKMTTLTRPSSDFYKLCVCKVPNITETQIDMANLIDVWIDFRILRVNSTPLSHQ